MSIVLIDDIQPGGAFKLVDVADLTPDVDTDGLVLTGDGAGNVGMEAASAHGDHHAQVHEIDGHDAATPLSVAKGGTGAATLTDHGVLLGSGTGAVTPTAVLATGQKLVGVTGADPVAQDDFETINFVINGGGAAIITGVKGYVEVDFACTITEWRCLLSAAESITVTITKATYADFATFSAFSPALAPATSGAVKGQATGLTTGITAGWILKYEVTSAPATAQLCTVALKVKRT